jgi:hypothetical protein
MIKMRNYLDGKKLTLFRNPALEVIACGMNGPSSNRVLDYDAV